ncbi:MAG: class I SAM-dependent methyltransferase [Myxococcales bacterium]|nr:class I SAM-dependent methyltransferase [Myxococcales bacterium]MCB9717842.1 class I SAM-dependent methyltransferase [Myxococcales bacterium]
MPAWILGVLVVTGCPRGGPGSGPPQHYDDPKAMIAVFESSERDEWQMPERVIRSLDIQDKGAVIADIGAGSGYFTRRLAAEVPGGRVFAVDVDGEFEDYLLENRESWGTPNIEPHLAMYDDPLLPANELDLVFAANTYAYIRDRVGYFGKVRAALKPGGRLALIDFRPDAEPPGNIAPAKEHRVSRDDAVAELGLAGFELEHEETYLPHQWFLVLTPKP